jgi:hypothetical protein
MAVMRECALLITIALILANDEYLARIEGAYLVSSKGEGTAR